MDINVDTLLKELPRIGQLLLAFTFKKMLFLALSRQESGGGGNMAWLAMRRSTLLKSIVILIAITYMSILVDTVTLLQQQEQA